MGKHLNPNICQLQRGTTKRIAYILRTSYNTVNALRSKFFLFNELELEALVAAHLKLAQEHKGFLGDTCYPDIHPISELHHARLKRVNSN